MLDLRAIDGALDTFHQRFQDDSLPESLSREAFAAFDKRRYDAATLDWGVRAWQLRTLDEYRSQVAFTELLHELTQLGCSFDIVGTAVRVVRDEARHVELCRRMVVALGGADQIPGTPDYNVSNKAMPLQLRVVSTIVGSLCIGETLSAAMLAAVRTETVDPLAKAVVTTLTADESIHGRFGWSVLPYFVPHLSADERATLEQVVPQALAGAEEAMVPKDLSEPEGPRNPFGSLGPKRRLEVYRKALEEDVLPRLRGLGLLLP